MKKLLVLMSVFVVLLTGCSKMNKSESNMLLSDMTSEEICSVLANKTMEYLFEFNDGQSAVSFDEKIFFYDFNSDGQDEYVFVFSDTINMIATIFEIKSDDIIELDKLYTTENEWKIYSNGENTVLNTQEYHDSLPSESYFFNYDYIEFDKELKTSKTSIFGYKNKETDAVVYKFTVATEKDSKEYPADKYDEKVEEVTNDFELIDTLTVEFDNLDISDTDTLYDYIFEVYESTK